MSDERANRAAEKLKSLWLIGRYIYPPTLTYAALDEISAVIAAEYADVIAENERLKHDVAMLRVIVQTDSDRGVLDTERIAALEQQVAHLTADAAETDQHIREAAKRVLPAAQVDGDSVCVPPLEDVIDALVQQVADVLAENGRLRGVVHELEESVNEAEARANERGRHGS